jgi:cytochrome P450
MTEDRNDNPDIYWDPFDFAIDDNPFAAWSALRERAPVYYNEKFDFYALSRYADVQLAFGDPKTFSNRRGTVYELIKGPDAVLEMMRNMLLEDPPVHTRQRALLSRTFTRRRVGDLEPVVSQLCTGFLDDVAGSAEFDLVEDLGSKIPMMVIGALLGVPESDREYIRDCANRGIALEDEDDTDFNTAPYMLLSEYFADLVAMRKKSPRDDIVSELVHVEMPSENGPVRLSEHEVRMYLVLLAAAGNETVARTVGWAGKVLADHPDQRALIAGSPDMIPNAVEEILRYEPTSPVQGRVAQRDLELHGVGIPEGSTVLLINGSANRDESVFPRADQFDPARKCDQHLAFSHGIHFCLGAALARLELRVILGQLLERHPTWEVDLARAEKARTSSLRGYRRLPILVAC